MMDHLRFCKLSVIRFINCRASRPEHLPRDTGSTEAPKTSQFAPRKFSIYIIEEVYSAHEF